MDVKTVIKQLRKALDAKDDKGAKDDEKLRLRVEVLADMLEETQPITLPIQPSQPATPLNPYYYESNPTPGLKPPYKTTSRSKGPNGPGAIVGGEQINYTRPAGT